MLLQIGYTQPFPMPEMPWWYNYLPLIAFIFAILDLVISYLIIRWAVKDAMRDTHGEIERMNAKIGRLVQLQEKPDHEVEPQHKFGPSVNEIYSKIIKGKVGE